MMTLSTKAKKKVAKPTVSNLGDAIPRGIYCDENRQDATFKLFRLIQSSDNLGQLSGQCVNPK